MLKQAISSKGYYMVGLYKNSRRRPVYIHRLVAEHFLDNTVDKDQVNHIDGNKLNNNYKNLEWCTCKDNVNHAHESGLCNPVKGEKVGTSKLTEKEVKQIRKIYSKEISQYKLANMFKVSQQMICKIINNKCWTNI
jgi:HNH endonuclease